MENTTDLLEDENAPEEKRSTKWSKPPNNETIWKRFDAAYNFNSQIGLYDTVQRNEDFYIGDQWKGVVSNGLPTPVFNMLKQVVNFACANISSDNMSIQATALPSTSTLTQSELDKYVEIINHQISAIMENCKIVTKLREFLRNAAVDGDGCMYYYFDPAIDNGQITKGEIVAEVMDNLRVHFGNPNRRDVQSQPYIIIAKRELVEDVQFKAEEYHKAGLNDITDPGEITADSEKFQNTYDSYTDDKITVLTYLYRNRDTKTIWAIESTEKGILRDAYDTELSLYPIVWLNWDYKKDCYHGQAMITGLIPNQTFVNKCFAMVGLSLILMGFPKVIYDRNRISRWDGSVGTAVGVNGSVADVAKTIEGATVNPQIAQFLQICIDYTKSFLGASEVALGNSRPDNTSAIIALQRAASTPMEITKQNLYQCLEDSGRIWIDMMATKYGVRKVEVSMPIDSAGQQPLGMDIPDMPFMEDFDFDNLKGLRLSIKLDPGSSSYWSEMATMQTLDNLLMNRMITPRQYIERLPNSYLAKKSELLAEMMAAEASTAPASPNPANEPTSEQIDPEGGPGNGALQRALNKEGT